MSRWVINKIICADAREALAAYKGQIDLIITSPPYADARKKHYDSVKPDDYAEWFMRFHAPFWEALKPNGSLVINIKDKIVNGVRHRYVWDTIQRLANSGWYCIDDYIWIKTNPMPGYWPTRLRDGWEYCFHLAKNKRPFIDQQALRKPISPSTIEAKKVRNPSQLQREPSANNSGFGVKRTNWLGKEFVLPSNIFSAAVGTASSGHPAVFPRQVPEFFIKLLTPMGGLVCDPFAGSGTTGLAAKALNRNYILIDNKEEYCQLAEQRLRNIKVVIKNNKLLSVNQRTQLTLNI